MVKFVDKTIRMGNLCSAPFADFWEMHTTALALSKQFPTTLVSYDYYGRDGKRKCRAQWRNGEPLRILKVG